MKGLRLKTQRLSLAGAIGGDTVHSAQAKYMGKQHAYTLGLLLYMFLQHHCPSLNMAVTSFDKPCPEQVIEKLQHFFIIMWYSSLLSLNI